LFWENVVLSFNFAVMILDKDCELIFSFLFPSLPNIFYLSFDILHNFAEHINIK